MNISAKVTDERVADIRCDDASLIVDLADGRTTRCPSLGIPAFCMGAPSNVAGGREVAAITAFIGPISTKT
jgi:hypothetical protein